MCVSRYTAHPKKTSVQYNIIIIMLRHTVHPCSSRCSWTSHHVYYVWCVKLPKSFIDALNAHNRTRRITPFEKIKNPFRPRIYCYIKYITYCALLCVFDEVAAVSRYVHYIAYSSWYTPNIIRGILLYTYTYTGNVCIIYLGIACVVSVC